MLKARGLKMCVIFFLYIILKLAAKKKKGFNTSFHINAGLIAPLKMCSTGTFLCGKKRSKSLVI